MTFPATGAPAPPVHEHDWHQCAVLHEDGYSTEEYSCSGCDGVWFR